MVLPDLYSFDGATGFTRPFSLMDDIGSAAPEYLAYERWLLGWIDDGQIMCTQESVDFLAHAVERPEGAKAVMVPVSEGRMVVVESRRAIGCDFALESEGAVVYVVDTSIPTGGPDPGGQPGTHRAPGRRVPHGRRRDDHRARRHGRRRPGTRRGGVIPGCRSS